jgi:hypothetical protein
MKYMLLIYGNENPSMQPTEAEIQAEMAAYFAFNEEMSKRGVLVHGEALHPTHSAKTARVRAGQPLFTDGPFAETKEQLGGYYLVDCKDLDEAIEIAAKIPGAAYGSVEIRPTVIFD